MEPLDFVGLTKLLGVQVIEVSSETENKYEPRSFVDVFADVMAKFNALSRRRKREILKLI
jgi:hypothetical protein